MPARPQTRSVIAHLAICILSSMFGNSIGNIALAAERVNQASLIADVEQAVVKKTNEFRISNDLKAVEVDEELKQAALKFAKFMASTGKYGHHADGSTPAERVQAAGYEYCVVRENIAYRTNTGEVTTEGLIKAFAEGWIDSPPHRENMLADYVTHTAVAVATTDEETYYAVQLFARPKSAAIKIKVTNESDEMRTLVVEANDSTDEVEMPARSVLTMTRCFPTTLSLPGQKPIAELKQSAELAITVDGAIEKRK